MVLKQPVIYTFKDESRHRFYNFHNNYFKMEHTPKYKMKLYETSRRKLMRPWISDILDTTLKFILLKNMFIKIKNLCFVKDT